MSTSLHVDEGVARPVGDPDAETAAELAARARPNFSGDLPALLEAAPMFRRAVAGYDRFQVDTYVQWAEDELATAEREREHLIARTLETRAALDEARLLLSHSPAGGEFLQLSGSIGTLLATAADEAQALRSDAAADRAAAADEWQRTTASAQALLLDAEARAVQLTTDAATEADAVNAAARRMLDEAEFQADAISTAARSEAEALRAAARLVEQRAAEESEQIRRQSIEEAVAVRLRARDEVLQMLTTGREERRRADAAAAAVRERLDQDAATRLAALLAEVDALEHRRSTLRAEREQMVGSATRPETGRLHLRLRRGVDMLRSRSLRTP